MLHRHASRVIANGVEKRLGKRGPAPKAVITKKMVVGGSQGCLLIGPAGTFISESARMTGYWMILGTDIADHEAQEEYPSTTTVASTIRSN